MLDEVIKIVAAVLSGLVIIALYSIPFYFLWNWLIPEIFILPSITLLDAYGFLIFLYLMKFLLSTKVHTEIE